MVARGRRCGDFVDELSLSRLVTVVGLVDSFLGLPTNALMRFVLCFDVFPLTSLGLNLTILIELAVIGQPPSFLDVFFLPKVLRDRFWVSISEEHLLSSHDVPLREETNSLNTIAKHGLRINVDSAGAFAIVDEAHLVSRSAGIYLLLFVELE